jgi:site-specific DNA-methyltransferase (adenine-specific)
MTETAQAPLAQFRLGYPSEAVGRSRLVHADCFDWLLRIPEESLHGVVTDPPYGVKEFDLDQIEKHATGQGGIWRIPPSFDGNVRSPLPRFTALNCKEREILREFFVLWTRAVLPALRPGAHVFLAGNSFLSQSVFSAVVEGGLEFRGEVVRLVSTLRGGDRPKNAEGEFPGVCSLPRGQYEPWGLFRKPLPPKMKVSECLREYGTGGLRRKLDGGPFGDVIWSERTPKHERAISAHPSLKPQSFLRQVVRAALPLGEGVLADPFMGSGSTVAAAEAIGYSCVGVERHAEYYAAAPGTVRRLTTLEVRLGAEAALRDSLAGSSAP